MPLKKITIRSLLSRKKLEFKTRRDTEKFRLLQTPLYIYGKGKDFIIIAVYIDDILTASRNFKIITKFRDEISRHFDAKDIGEVAYCFNVEFNINKDEVTMHRCSKATSMT